MSHDTFPGKCLGKSLWQGDLNYHGVKEKHQPLYQKLVLNMAGAEGFEPSTKVLETHVLPLHHAPKRNNDYYSSLWDICQGEIDPFFYFQEKAGIRAQPRSF